MTKGYRKSDGKPCGCSNKGKISPLRNGKYVECGYCQKLFYVIKCRIGIRKFCSKKCCDKGFFGKSNPKNLGKNNGNWCGGRRKNYQGYILILDKNHPFCDRFGYVKEHRLVMEEHLGRYLSPKEVVHHINKNIQDNKISNLQLFPNNSEHVRFHRLNP